MEGVSRDILLSMATLYLLRYNNYYNRTIKQEDNLTAYLTYAIPFSVSKTGIEGVNFNPNDGVNTTQIINWNNTVPDYLLVVDNNTIISRWFIIEMARTRGGQYKLTLRRDVIVDNYINVLNAHIFIDKAKVPDTDIAIYNKEPYKFNSIKQGETLLKDETECAWIVGYISQKDVDLEEGSLTGTVKAFTDDNSVQYIYDNVDSYFSSQIFTGINGGNLENHKKTFYGYTDITAEIPTIYGTAGDYNTGFWKYSGSSANIVASRSSGKISTLATGYAKQLSNGTLNTSGIMSDRLFAASISKMEDKLDDIKLGYASYKNWNDESKINRLLEEDGKIIKDNTSEKYYIINVRPITIPGTTDYINSSTAPSLANLFKYVVDNTTATVLLATGTLTEGDTQLYNIIYESYNNYEISLEEISLSLTYTIPSDDTRNHLSDAPYDMFCMPYGNKAFYKNGVAIGNSNKFLNMSAAMSIVSDLSGVGFVYDIQLLPYCPLDSNYITASGDIDIRDMEVGKIKSNLSELGWFMFCTQSTFSFSIPVNINIDDYKMQHQLDNWRFNSPNWSGSYDFDVTLNKGLSYVDIDCTYKPYTPYIHVCPRFNNNGYYGYNNKDAVGLICGGDFSLPMTTDQWKTYEYQNKNYQNQFDRQIQNINTNYRLDTIERGANMVTGAVSGAMSGAVIGAMGGPGGMAVGAAIGGIASIGGGIADQAIAEQRKEENISYATDQFNYQIDNIKSLPYTLSKVSALNGNNKLFPFIEYFSSSDQEKNIFRDLIKWNGMTVNRMGTLADFKVEGELNYFSGRLVRANVSDESHMVSAIANELSRGVFI